MPPVILAIHSINHVCEHVNIPEYTEHILAYMDLRNQGVTNAGENVRYIHTQLISQ